MPNISDILNIDLLASEIRDGYVTERTHPEFPELRIYNYSPKCQYENRWNPVTMLTRGLICNAVNGEVLARAFPKFFNWGDPNVGDVDLDAEPYGVLDKLDGSLGVQYTLPDGREAIATRGSFTSDQAVWATDWLRSSTKAEARPAPSGTTQVWEIIYPANRIVLDYGNRAECVLLGFIDNETGGYDYPVNNPDSYSRWDVAIPERFAPKTVREALSAPPRKNAEGVVVWLSESRAMKLKQADYVELHRIVSNLSEKEAWRQLRAGTFEEFAANLPDEFHQWARDTSEPLNHRYLEIMREADWLRLEVQESVPPDRKSQALWIAANAPVEYRGFVFGLLDGKDISDGIWKLLEPKGDAPRISDE